MTRFALIVNADSEEQLKRYLPDNYYLHNHSLNGDVWLIYGEDKAGWTMEDYIIPRLQSGLMQAYEIPYGLGLALTR